MQRTPKDEGYRMPPEWHKHSGTQLHWPENIETWPGEWLIRVERLYLEIIRNLEKYEPVFLFVNTEERKRYVLEQLQENSLEDANIYFQVKKTNDVWARDCGPVFVKRDGETRSLPSPIGGTMPGERNILHSMMTMPFQVILLKNSG